MGRQTREANTLLGATVMLTHQRTVNDPLYTVDCILYIDPLYMVDCEEIRCTWRTINRSIVYGRL